MSEKAELSVRRLTPEAAPDVVAIHRRVFPTDALRYSIYASKKIGAFVAATMPTTENSYLGAYLDGELAGYAHVRSADDRAHLNYIAVSREKRAQGVGGRLMERVMHDAREAGFATMSLDVSADDSDLRAWYESRGFRPVSGPRSAVLIDAASVPLGISSAAICISGEQWTRYLRFELSDIDVCVANDTFKVGLLGERIFRVQENPRRELLAAARDFDESRDFLVADAALHSIDFDHRVVGRSISMESPL